MPRSVAPGFEAARLLGLIDAAGPSGLIHVTIGEDRARAMARFIASVAPDLSVHVLPPWDCLPYDTASPSAEAMGQRLQVLRQLRDGVASRPVVIAPLDAALQRLPPLTAMAAFRVEVGAELDLEELRRFCQRRGYAVDERVDEPGEVAFRGEVVDIFPGGCLHPYRLEIKTGRIAAIRCYDAVTQRSIEDAATLVIDAVSELPESVLLEGERRAGAEHGLPDAYPALATLFDYLPEATLAEARGVAAARRALVAQVMEAHRDRVDMQEPGNGPALPVPEPGRLYLMEEDWRRLTAKRQPTVLELEERERVPVFATMPRPRHALLAFMKEQAEHGRRIALTGATSAELRRLLARARFPESSPPTTAQSWRDVSAADGASVLALEADLDHGFVDQASGVAVITAADLLGSRARALSTGDAVSLWQVELGELHLGDVVVHTDHGAARLEGLETIGQLDQPAHAIRLGYAHGEVLLTPPDEVAKIWRYGSEESDVALDRLKGASWSRRRQKVATALAETAKHLVAKAAERRQRTAPKLEPKQPTCDRFVTRFRYALTADQQRSVDAVLADLASGRPMDRLVVGDVGFGKTEVALRAAATVASAGKQVAVIAPTTVLARQHFDTFLRRFAGLDVAVAMLSRLVPPKDAKAVRQGLAEGRVGIVVGTHSLLGKQVSFADLGLLVIDEEQRFGAAHKATLKALGRDVHVLSMTATPIPRTLQTALVGLQELSTIATPPRRRRPIRTMIGERAPAALRQALLREKRRGGQSFVVVPRVEDVAPVAASLREIVPELALKIAHGDLPPREVDEAIVGFAAGRGDVLLATSIIESGLDVPRANTMIVLRPSLFGLAQLHQLRGRVGRGYMQAFCYLMNEPGEALSEAAGRRLGTLEALDRLGAGMAISLHDVDLRGGGDLFGERQTGHVKLIGLSLYQEMLAAALRRAKNEPDEAEEVHLALAGLGLIPDDYVPEPIVRINLYHRLARTREPADVDRLAEEIADRFGPPPASVEHLLAAASLKALARSLGVVRLAAGPKGVTLQFPAGSAIARGCAEATRRLNGELEWQGQKLLYRHSAETPEAQREAALALLHELA